MLYADKNAAFLEFEGNCLGVLGARAVQVPCGVRTQLTALPDLVDGARLAVADGSIALDGIEVLVTNIVDTTVPVLGPDDCVAAAAQLDRLISDEVTQVVQDLPAEGIEQLHVGDPEGARTLLGVGPGLTPLGDDVMAGWLATAVASRHPQLQAMRSIVALEAFERTSLLSATLLACAARGEGVPEFRSLLRGVATGNDHVVEQSLALLMSLNDPGPGLVLGALLALQSH